MISEERCHPSSRPSLSAPAVGPTLLLSLEKRTAIPLLLFNVIRKRFDSPKTKNLDSLGLVHLRLETALEELVGSLRSPHHLVGDATSKTGSEKAESVGESRHGVCVWSRVSMKERNLEMSREGVGLSLPSLIAGPSDLLEPST